MRFYTISCKVLGLTLKNTAAFNVAIRQESDCTWTCASQLGEKRGKSICTRFTCTDTNEFAGKKTCPLNFANETMWWNC